MRSGHVVADRTGLSMHHRTQNQNPDAECNNKHSSFCHLNLLSFAEQRY
jgi:hypothetical protein